MITIVCWTYLNAHSDKYIQLSKQVGSDIVDDFFLTKVTGDNPNNYG